MPTKKSKKKQLFIWGEKKKITVWGQCVGEC